MPSSYTLGNHFETFVRTLVESGRYASASEVMRDGLRLLEEREEMRVSRLEALRVAVRAGRDSGEPLDAEDVLNRLDARYAARAAS